MAFDANWTELADAKFKELQEQAVKAHENRSKSPKKKKSKVEGLFAQLQKTISLLLDNPRHPGLNTHRFVGKPHPYVLKETVFEAYVQNNTPGAYRVFWCYGPNKGELTIIEISPHP